LVNGFVDNDADTWVDAIEIINGLIEAFFKERLTGFQVGCECVVNRHRLILFVLKTEAFFETLDDIIVIEMSVILVNVTIHTTFVGTLHGDFNV
jgi:hypothetical protein